MGNKCRTNGRARRNTEAVARNELRAERGDSAQIKLLSEHKQCREYKRLAYKIGVGKDKKK
jgi:hypothetical protein